MVNQLVSNFEIISMVYYIQDITPGKTEVGLKGGKEKTLRHILY